MLIWRSWQATLVLGLFTILLGIVVTIDPSRSLNVIAVLVGVLLLLGGALGLLQALASQTEHRGSAALAGLALIVIGVVLIRHIHLTRVVIALLVGIVWIVQGVVQLIIAASADRDRPDRGWAIRFAIVTLIAGIVVVASPVGSLLVRAVLLGIWFIVIGVFETLGALVLRRTAKHLS